MITDQQYLDWLDTPGKKRVVLAIVQSSGGTFYLANRPYISFPTDTPANQPFDDLIIAVPELVSTLDESINVGDLDVHNSGDLDGWVNDVWRGYPLKIYLGDESWVFSDFRLIMDGVCGGLSVPDSGRLVLSIRDKMELLRVPVQSATNSEDQRIPIALGYCFNVSPLLIDAPTHKYQVNDGTATIHAVRDNGVNVAGFTDNGDGTFTLTSSPAGQITCDVTANGTTIKAHLEWLAQRAITLAEVDSTQLSDLPTFEVAKYISGEETIEEVMQHLCAAVGAVPLFTRLGKLQAKRYVIADTPSRYYDADHVVAENSFDGLVVEGDEAPKSNVRLAYLYNNTQQSSVAGAVSEANRDLYGREYSTVEEATTASGLPLLQPSETIVTALRLQADAITEAQRRAVIRSAKRLRYSVEMTTAPFGVEVGDQVNITYPRYGFESGKDVLVVGLEERPTDNRVRMEVWA